MTSNGDLMVTSQCEGVTPSLFERYQLALEDETK